MAARNLILAIDQGTTSTRAIVYDGGATPLATERREFAQHYPERGWVEHDPEDIWRDVVDTARAAIGRVGGADAIGAIGITNQRETVVVWDRDTGEPVGRAIVWQDRRTARFCERLRADGAEATIQARTGLLIDPYFSASKLRWILDEMDGARARADAGKLAFGTIDSFLLWRLTGGRVHATDATNAARTQLFNIHDGDWDDELLRMFGVPRAMLPAVRDNAGAFGDTDAALFGGRAIPVRGMAGDQQAAVIGQACFRPGMAKSTYGTGCFMLLNTGDAAVASPNRMLTTIAYRLDGRTTYAQEGAIFVAGAAVRWLRDGIGLITHASQTDDMATGVADNGGVYMVPGFVGLGAPHWDPDARGLIAGLTLGSTAAHVARAALEAVAYQTLDLADAMRDDGAGRAAAMRVDGGMAANDWFCQFLADMLQVPVERPTELESTARGAAFLAGLATGVWDGTDAIARAWTCGRRFTPGLDAAARERLIAGWRDALARATLKRG